MSPASRSFVLAAAAALFGIAPASHALTVTTSGYFESWTGTVGSDGQFTTTINGQVICPDAGCNSGVGVYTDPPLADPNCDVTSSLFCDGAISSLEFGISDRFATPQVRPLNRIQVTGIQASPQTNTVKVGDTIVIGHLQYQNGQWFTGPDLKFSMSSRVLECPLLANCARIEDYVARPDLDGYWTDTLRLTVTPNTGTVADNADSLCFVDHPGFGCFRVYEPADTADPFGEVELLGRIGSLEVAGFGNVISGGYVQAAVPLPPVAWLGAPALAMLARFARRRRPG